VEVEIVTRAVAQGARIASASQPLSLDESTPQADWRPDPLEPRLMLEREVIKARVQQPGIVGGWSAIEDGAFTHPSYSALAVTINSLGATRAISSDEISDPQMRALFTELSVEPIKSDGEVTEHYVASLVARLREVGVSRAIADLKSRLQRLNPVENGEEYNASFAQLVALESTRRELHELALKSL
jgi:DNA primase